jgi:uncharacterized protein (TIGR00297 family)
LIFGMGGFPWAVLLLAFFISSSALSKMFKKRKASLAEKYAKGDRRDWGQVMANGALGAVLAVLYILLSHPTWLWLGFAGAMAAVNADTWSTELGVLSPIAPRMITDGRVVERGTSGGITLIGTLAALGGAAFIAAAALISRASPKWLLSLGIIVLAGLVGALIDSVLGATVQAIYWCPSCEKETERHPTHTCGSPTRQVRGWSWVNNDLVNFICSLSGAMAAVGLYLILFPH